MTLWRTPPKPQPRRLAWLAVLLSRSLRSLLAVLTSPSVVLPGDSVSRLSARFARGNRGCPFESHPAPHSTIGRRSCSLTPFAARAATSVLPLAPCGRSRDRSLTPPQPRHRTTSGCKRELRSRPVAGGGCRQRLPRTGVAGGCAAGCQRDLRSLAARGPPGRSPGRATASDLTLILLRQRRRYATDKRENCGSARSGVTRRRRPRLRRRRRRRRSPPRRRPRTGALRG